MPAGAAAPAAGLAAVVAPARRRRRTVRRQEVHGDEGHAAPGAVRLLERQPKIERRLGGIDADEMVVGLEGRR